MKTRFKKGDEVFVVHAYMREPVKQKTTIEKIGRKWVYVKGMKDPFDPVTGSIQDGYGRTYLRTPADLDRQAAASAAKKALDAFGIETWRLGDEKCLRVYEALRPLIEEEIAAKGAK
jgi:hypothetical protein